MNSQTIGLWVLSSANAIVLATLAGRAAVAHARVRKWESDRMVVNVALGTRVPSVSCRTWTGEGELGRSRTGTFRPGSVVVFVQPRSAASFRVTRLVHRLAELSPSDVAWTWVIVGVPSEATRWVSDFGLRVTAVHCRRRGFVRRFADAVPRAIYVDDRRRIAQAGAISDDMTLAQFIAGCPSAELRNWFSSVSVSKESGSPVIS
jgi:hypothetical protein